MSSPSTSKRWLAIAWTCLAAVVAAYLAWIPMAILYGKIPDAPLHQAAYIFVRQSLPVIVIAAFPLIGGSALIRSRYWLGLAVIGLTPPAAVLGLRIFL